MLIRGMQQRHVLALSIDIIDQQASCQPGNAYPPAVGLDYDDYTPDDDCEKETKYCSNGESITSNPKKQQLLSRRDFCIT